MKKYILILPFLIIILLQEHKAFGLCTYTPLNEKGKSSITISFPLKKNDYIYKDYLDFSVDDPHVKLSPWKANQPAIEKYDPHFKEYKKIFPKPLTVTLDIYFTTTHPLTPVYLHMTYHHKSKNLLQRKIFPLHYEKHCKESIQTSINTNMSLPTNIALSLTSKYSTPTSSTPLLERTLQELHNKPSFFIHVLLSGALGFFLSFTRSIYSIIPIIIGILCVYGSISILHTILLSLLYILGLTLTFASLGLYTIFSGQFFESFTLVHPLIIIAMVILLLYLAGSLLGLYEIYTPHYKSNNSLSKVWTKKDLMWVFLYGIVSGIIIFSCIASRLMIILHLDALRPSAYTIFILLFACGVGVTLPLLCSGFFSYILTFFILPIEAIEIERLYGFLLIGTSFYLLNSFIALHILLLLLATTLLVIGIFYNFTLKSISDRSNIIKSIMGCSMIACSPIIFFKAYQARQFPQNKSTGYTNYHTASIQPQGKNNEALMLTQK